jgi:glucose-6-phosphate 1-epimerase
MSDLSSLQSRFNIPGLITVSSGDGGLTKVSLTPPGAEAAVYLHGACLTRYQPAGQPPLLFCSQTSKYEPGKAIRGGVPIIFPWFGPHPTDPQKGQHGFARLAAWEIAETRQNPDGSATVVLALESSPSTRAAWPHDFSLRYAITVGASLDMALTTTNTGSAEFSFDEALHTYFTVSDVRRITITGLENTPYLDKVEGGKRKEQGEEPLRLTGETDRVFLGTEGPCTIHDPVHPPIVITKEGSRCTVVWNPWETKAEAAPDMAGGQWPSFVCVEAVNTADYTVSLAPGASHTLRCTLHR